MQNKTAVSIYWNADIWKNRELKFRLQCTIGSLKVAKKSKKADGEERQKSRRAENTSEMSRQKEWESGRKNEEERGGVDEKQKDIMGRDRGRVKEAKEERPKRWTAHSNENSI